MNFEIDWKSTYRAERKERRERRLANIKATSVFGWETSLRMVVHLFPEGEHCAEIGSETLQKINGEIAPIISTETREVIGPEPGLVRFSIRGGYLNLLDDCAIEIVLGPTYHEDKKLLPLSYEKDIAEAAAAGVRALGALGVPPPLFMTFALLGAEGYALEEKRPAPFESVISPKRLKFNDFTFSTFEFEISQYETAREDIERFLKSRFDYILESAELRRVMDEESKK